VSCIFAGSARFQALFAFKFFVNIANYSWPMRQYLLPMIVALTITVAADELLFGGRFTLQPTRAAGETALQEFNYQLELLLRRVP
jgi:hypothetical protein